MKSRFGLCKFFFPIFVAVDSVVMIPKGLKYILVVEQQSDWAGKFHPNRIINFLFVVEFQNTKEKSIENTPLGYKVPVRHIFGISGVES